MSCFIVSIDHIGYLVNLGYQLDIRSVYNEHCNLAQRLTLADSSDRCYVASELMAANNTSVHTRYGDRLRHIVEVIDVPEIKLPPVAFNNLAQFAQALQWVRCYQYQSCDDPGWTTTFAYHYTERLRTELESKIIACFTTSWVYDGPPLTGPR